MSNGYICETCGKTADSLNKDHECADCILEDLKEDGKLKTKWVITPTEFRHIKTGEIVTQIPLMQIADYEKVEDVK